MKKIAALIALSTSLAILLTGCGSSKQVASKSYVAGNGTVTFIEPKDRKMGPTFSGKTLEGENFELPHGGIVVVNVWASWCGPCRAELPFLKKIEEKYNGRNIEFVSISVDVAKDHDKWKAFVTEKQLQGIQLFADKDWKSDFIMSYGINSIPRFILIDPKGMIVDADAARPSDPKLAEKLDSLLK